MIHICNVKLSPRSTVEEPWRFESMRDAMELSRIIRQPFYAAVVGFDWVRQVWPGGRVVEYPPAVLAAIRERNARARKRRSKKPAI